MACRGDPERADLEPGAVLHLPEVQLGAHVLAVVQVVGASHPAGDARRTVHGHGPRVGAARRCRHDWRGCGLSDRDKINSSLNDYVDDLEAVVRAAELERFALFGMAGMGGAISISYAARQPERVACLVLQESHTKGRLAGNPSPLQVAEQQARLKVIELGWPDDTPAYSQFHAALHIPNASAAQMRAYNELLRRSTTLEQAINWARGRDIIPARILVPRGRLPDNLYAFDSGGDPAAIPDLTYEQFKTFHDDYYHPSNAYIYFYGDDPEDDGQPQCFSHDLLLVTFSY